jgi:hypothetical protein
MTVPQPNNFIAIKYNRLAFYKTEGLLMFLVFHEIRRSALHA